MLSGKIAEVRCKKTSFSLLLRTKDTAFLWLVIGHGTWALGPSTARMFTIATTGAIGIFIVGGDPTGADQFLHKGTIVTRDGIMKENVRKDQNAGA